MALTTKNGDILHPIGIGTWNISSRINDSLPEGRFRNVEAVRGNEQEEIDGLRYSIERGQNHLDCAELYGAFYTDEVVGRALEASSVERKNLFIADKLWKHSSAPNAARPTVEQMLSKLRTDYLDLLYIHAAWTDVNWRDAIPQIDDLIDEGIVRSFGVSNFTVDEMIQAQAIARHPISVNQMHFSCLHRDEVDEEFRSFCKEHDIAIVAYRPTERGQALVHPVLIDIATAHGATPAQIALAWLMQMGTLPITKTIQKAHIDENLGALQITLSEHDLEKIATI
jgi:2,5-diketo-D-gluconate reductase B